MPYVPNPTQATEPVESREVLTAAREFRELKGSVNTRIAALTAADATLQSNIDAEAATRAAADSGLNVRTTALEQLAFNGGTPGAVVTKQFTATASQTIFVLDFAPISVAQVSVYLQGIYQHRDTFSVSGANVVLSTGVEAGTLVEITANVPLLLGETSADLVEYLPAGTGAVATTVQQALRDIQSYEVNVRAAPFYAVGDGVTDDTAAIQAAINACSARSSGYYAETNGLSIYFPWGTYKITQPLVVPNNAGISFVGDGGTKSKIWQSVNGQDAFQLSGGNYRGWFNGVHITGNQGQIGGTAKAINISGSGNQIYVQNCWLTLFGYCIYGAPTSDSNFSSNVFEYSHTPISLSGAGNGYFNITNNQFYNCGPVSLGASEQRSTFEFSSTVNTVFADNRIVVDSPMSPQNTNGVFNLSSVNDFTCSNNIFTGTNYDGRTFLITSSNRLKFVNNTLKASRGQQFGLTSCKEILISGNTIPTVKNPGAIADNLVSVNSCVDFQFLGNYVGRSTLYGVWVRGSGSEAITIANNIFDGGTSIALNQTVLVQATSRAVVTNNVFVNAGSNNHDLAINTSTYVVVSGNSFDKGYSIDPTTAPGFVDGNIGGTTRTYYNVAPTTGTWRTGDKVYFTAPTADGNIGAVCVASGTPGTWKTFGAVAV